MRGVGLPNVRTGRGSEQVAEVVNPDAGGRIVLVCEHASNHIPEEFDGLGLTEEIRKSHIAWDPGAGAVAQAMSERLNAPLVASRISRLVYDCNRPSDADAAIPARSELHEIPGNVDLSPLERAARVRDYYEPFRDLLAETLARAGAGTILVTVHSFTPVFFERLREVEIGVLHDRDSRLADAMLASAAGHTGHVVRRNEPYSARDGVTHTLKVHGMGNGLVNVMLEIRNDLIANGDAQVEMASMLCDWLAASIDALDADMEVA